MKILKRGRYWRTLVMIIGALLMLLNLAGSFLPSRPIFPGTTARKKIPGYDYPVLDKAVLLKLLRQKTDTSSPTVLADLTNTVYFGMYHTEERSIHFFENWLLWLTAKFYPPFGRTQDAYLLVKGRAGNCSERVQVLMEIYKRNGIDAQALLLNGHVALQVLFRGANTITDPDFGLVRPGNIEEMRNPAGLAFADSFLLARGFGQRVRDYYGYAWRVTSDDKILPMNKPTSWRLYHFEKLTQWLKWLLPLSLIALGALTSRRAEQQKNISPG